MPDLSSPRRLVVELPLPPKKKREDGKAAPNRREAREQAALFKFLRLWQREYPRLAFVFHVPNGLALHPAVASQAVEQGVKRGVWDICAIGPEGRCLWIEMKAGRNQLTEEQDAFGEYVRSGGHNTSVCRSWIEAARVLCDHCSVPWQAGQNGANPKIVEALR